MNVELRLPSERPPVVEDRFTFAAFAEQKEYIEVNRSLIQKIMRFLLQGFTHVDVATGTGMVPKLIIEASNSGPKEGKIIGIDPNEISLKIARQTTPRSNGISVEYIQGYGQNLMELLKGKVPEEGVDGISIHDAIHEVEGVPNKKIIIRNMAASLRPGGIFSYNSAFTNKAIEGSAMDWGKWKLSALSILNGRRNRKIESIEVLSPEDYKTMIVSSGLEVVHEELKAVRLSRAALEAISRYPRFVEGVFADMIDTAKVAVESKSEALITAIDQLNIQTIQRTWHEIIAQKPPTATSLA